MDKFKQAKSELPGKSDDEIVSSIRLGDSHPHQPESVIEDRLNRLHKRLVKAVEDRIASDMPGTSCLRTVLEGDVAIIETETTAMEYTVRYYDWGKEAWVDWQRNARTRARRKRNERIWLGMQDFYTLLIPAAFAADRDLRIVRGRVIGPELGSGICVFSVEADRTQAERAKGMSSPEAAFQQFDSRPSTFARFTMQPVIPHGEDHQVSIGASMSELSSMSPTEFEHRIAAWLRAMGFAVTVTGGTGDEGIDLIAYNSEPVTGGKYVVQCKRYAPGNDVGVREVRDLYGSLTSEKANKGILITTSRFTAAAKSFAVGKPLELIDGLGLAQLLETAESGLDTPQQEYLSPHEDEEDLESGEAVPDSRDAIVEFLKVAFQTLLGGQEAFEPWFRMITETTICSTDANRGLAITDEALVKLQQFEKRFLASSFPESSCAARDSLIAVCRKRVEMLDVRKGTGNDFEADVTELNKHANESMSALNELLSKFKITQEESRKLINDMGYGHRIKD